MIGGRGEDFIIVLVIYPRGLVSVSLLGYFLYVGYSSKTSRLSLPVSLRAHHIQGYFNNKRGRKRKLIEPQQEKASHEEHMKLSKVIVQEELVLGYLELIPMESGAELSALQDLGTVMVA